MNRFEHTETPDPITQSLHSPCLSNTGISVLVLVPPDSETEAQNFPLLQPELSLIVLEVVQLAVQSFS